MAQNQPKLGVLEQLYGWYIHYQSTFVKKHL